MLLQVVQKQKPLTKAYVPHAHAGKETPHHDVPLIKNNGSHGRKANKEVILRKLRVDIPQ